MYPVSNKPLVLNASSVVGTGIMRTANKGINQEILKHPRTYSFRVSENSISGTGGFMFQENTKEYKTGITWINKGATTGKTYITDTTSTVSTYNNNAYYYARRTTTGESDSITIDQYMCALGNDAEYEPYNGNTYTVTAGQTIEIDALDGVNTLICSAGTMTVSYAPKTNTTEV